jgi:2-C-methyl-D-erythritol 2,4-cyclodiphosphate synthase
MWLGLVRIDAAQGLDGHSDADVATHALCDALLGAAGLGDIGRHFPSSEATWAGARSHDLLDHTLAAIAESGFVLVNADVTIVAQVPILLPHLPTMADALSAATGAPVSVKATTTDTIGAIGRGEGVAAMAVVLVDDRV